MTGLQVVLLCVAWSTLTGVAVYAICKINANDLPRRFNELKLDYDRLSNELRITKEDCSRRIGNKDSQFQSACQTWRDEKQHLLGKIAKLQKELSLMKRKYK